MSSNKRVAMLTEYFNHQVDLERLYGKKAVVLYQCGGFFEVYEERTCGCADPQPPTAKEPRLCANCRCVAAGIVPRGKASIMRDVWNTAMPAKSDRFWMAGFPSDNRPAFVRHLRTLTNAGWTAAVYRQHDSTDVNRLATKREKVRLLDKIHSRGIYGRDADGDRDECLSPLATGDRHTTMCIFVRQTRFGEGEASTPAECMYEVGVATFDLDTQAVGCGETYTLENDQTLPFARLRAFLCERAPREFLVACDGAAPDEIAAVLKENGIVLAETGTVVREASAPLQRAPQREAIFAEVFLCAQSSGVPVAQRIGVARRSIAAIALAELIAFVEHHDKGLVTNLPMPVPVFGTANLVLHTTTLRQLDVLPPLDAAAAARTDGPGCLLEVVSNCATPFGRDLLRERLCRPSTDAAEIRRRSALVASLLTSHQGIQANGLKHLAQLHRVVARLRSHRVTYAQVGALARMVGHALRLYDGPLRKHMHSDPGLLKFVQSHLPAGDRDRLQALGEELATTFDLARVGRVSAADPERTSCLRAGVDADVDRLATRLADLLGYLRAVNAALRDALPAVRVGNRKKPTEVAEGDMCVATTAADKRRYFFELMSAAARSAKAVARGAHKAGAVRLVPAPAAVRAALEGYDVAFPDGKRRAAWSDAHQTTSYNGRAYVCFEWQRHVAEAVLECHRELAAAVKARFRLVVAGLHGRYYDVLHRLFLLAAELDVAASSAAVANAYSYTMPSVLTEGPAMFEAEGLRHPIIERLDTATEYVSNDVAFGAGKVGYLVHGVNAAGKSSLMKSVGLAVIMAQAGLFVPARRLVLRPYHHLFTRITKKDDLFAGLSSFQVEMLEIGDIIRRCDDRSLVIGDELCSGTETTSAVAIVGASIDHLARRRSHFMFATHLHELRSLPDIAANATVRSVHMSVESGADGSIVYTRRLTPGCGPDTYGVEACRNIGLPAEFLRKAKRYRAHLKTRGQSALRPSSYNPAMLFGDRCAVAGCTRPSEDMHHIVHQQCANATGHLADGRHKNARSNLVPLCKHHHKRAHRPGAPDVIARWVMTSGGPRVELVDGGIDADTDTTSSQQQHGFPSAAV